MKTLFSLEDTNEILGRIEKLTPQTEHLWGKMNVSQMLSHCSKTIEVATGDKIIPRTFIGKAIGWMFRPMFTNEKPFSKNGPTADYFITTDEKEFEPEKTGLKKWVIKFHQGGKEKCTTHPHAFFGKLTAEEWGMGMYKHLDHHLRQFGV